MNTIARIPILAVLALALAPAASRAQQAFQTSWLGYESGTHSTAEWPWAMRLADLDGDGDVDIATVNWWFHHKLGIQMNNGDGTFAPAVYYNHALGSLGLVVADITGDGQPDVVVSNTGANGEGSTVSLFRNLGGGTFATQQQFTVGSGSFVGPVGLAAADFNADGRPDVLWRNPTTFDIDLWYMHGTA
ncbi:MAG TPA: VCBS repeat-containing protein, partial [Planctomycetota bacterium]|nr:VCBS repeat-containing protein [Planctomycetota bacterium]